jgi:GTPase SAR1 family protein
MDYIRKQIDDRIDFLQTMGDKNALKQHIQARFEYVLVYLLAYLWNKNIEKLDYEDKEFVFQNIIKPTIGSVVAICRKLDIDKEIFKKSKLSQALDKYPSIRNGLLGHGFVYEDATEKLLSTLQELYDCVLISDLPILKDSVDLVYVTNIENTTYKGILYKSDGARYIAWSCPKTIGSFELGSLYASTELNTYFRLSPFIEITSYGKELYFFNSIDEKILGKMKYNRLLETGVLFKEWEELCELDITNDGVKVKSHNGTIRNIYENNYRKYIDIGIKGKLKNFLIGSSAGSSVCATVWGHGGVGKTATIQSLCEDLANDERKVFDYIVFLSAKDRRYDYYTGNIEEINDRIATFSDLIKGVNKVLFNIESDNPKHIIEINGKKVFLVVDDFETFPKEEKDKIEDFIDQLNINHHKVIITTRAANINIGKEFQTNELTEQETVKFLLKVIKNEDGNDEVIKRQLENPENSHKVFEITSGRPLFIFQFAFVLGQRGLKDALNFKIKEGDSAISFLFGRIYDYLSPKAKDLFVVLSLLVTQDDLSNVIEKAQYILNLEHEIDTFNSAVNELVKLKILKIDEERKFFEIYSKEIFQIMTDYFEKRPSVFKGNCISRRNQVNRDKTLDVEHSLLLTANANRLAKNEIEVIDSYKQIINRASSPIEVKLPAILNLAAYLVDRDKKELALKYLDDYSYHFNKNAAKGSNEKLYYATFTKMWATYYWANGTREQKEKAIASLLAYASSGFNFNADIDLEISGMLLQYRSILVISDWQDLKEKSNYNEIIGSEFKALREKQKQECKDIHDKQGIVLYNAIMPKKLDEISSGARQNVLAGLYSFLEVLVNLQKVDLALRICEYASHCAPKSFQPQFKKKERLYSRRYWNKKTR